MKTLLVNPPWYCFQNRRERYLPLGIAYIAGALTASGYNVKILNGEVVLAPYTLKENSKTPTAFFHATDRYVKYHDISLPLWEILGNAIIKESPDVVGLSMWSGSYLSVLNICRVIKILNPDIITVVGGVHPTLDPISVIEHPEVDFVVRGEGERVVVDLWKLIEEGGDIHRKACSIRGVWTKVNDKIHQNDKADMIEEIDEIPFPNYEVIVNENPAQAILGIMTARGCPFNCTFCASKTIWGKKVRFRSIDSCIDELRYYRERFGLKWFRVNDDSFCISKQRVLEFCDKLVENFGHTWNFAIDANVNNLDEEIIRKLEWAGCTGISIGIESVVPRIQKLSRKYINLNHARKIISCVNKSKIACGAYFMTGFPEETEKELLETVKFMSMTKPENSMWSIVTPYPGTELHQYAVQKGILPDASPIHFMHHSLKTAMANIPLERYKKILHRILRIRDKIACRYRYKRNCYGFKSLLLGLSRPRSSFRKLIEKVTKGKWRNLKSQS